MKALVARVDGFGGVLLCGPAVRAVATRADRVAMLCPADAAPAARLLPHVDDVIEWDPARPRPDADGSDLVGRLSSGAYDVALVLTPGGASPLPLARLLREARVGRIGADSDRPAGVLDVPHRRLPGRHEAEAALDTAEAMGFRLRAGDQGRLRVLPAPDTAGLTGNGPYVVLHPGAAATAAGPGPCARTVALLADAGHRVVVTGTPDEADATRRISADIAVDLGGRTDPRALAGVLRAADVLVTGDPDTAQLAAAVGTPVVSLTAEAAPEGERTPYKVPVVRCGDGRPADVVRAIRHLLAHLPR
ncbi:MULTISPECIES: glycosyltransferase family 9 protein [Streptomyces]|uniref:Glycosyl transferase n=2 Tax=Streptomyces TaxID=1883 RepID=A0A2U9NW50_STRAS|nr:glycosyltransferase family 9 protein [Streptomyces actuosus]AWT41261.1 glycosyl transferase [Streptomyces actuosus]MBM4826201.1 glycosyltransferase family 9 protein [Streptomyces actuosus]